MASAGMPMSITSSWPQRSAPGYMSWPIFGNANVAVTVARTAWPSGRPLSADRPDGRSIASTGRPAALMASIMAANTPATGVLSPVPSSASTTTPERSSRRASASTWPGDSTV